jgi:hypothetical protein
MKKNIYFELVSNSGIQQFRVLNTAFLLLVFKVSNFPHWLQQKVSTSFPDYRETKDNVRQNSLIHPAF